MKLLTSRHYQKIGIVLFFLLFFNVTYAQVNQNAVSALQTQINNQAGVVSQDQNTYNTWYNIYYGTQNQAYYEFMIGAYNALAIATNTLNALNAQLTALQLQIAQSMPKSLPSGAIGAANLIPGFGVNLTGSLLNQPFFSPATSNNVIQLLTEFHFVSLGSSGYSAATYQDNYATCANGGIFTGSVVSINSTSLYYFCTLPVYPWYLSSTHPVIYSGATSSYYTEQQNLINWTNPNLPAGSGVTEQISTNAQYRNGIIPTTFILSNCDPSTTSASTNVYYTNSGMTLPFTFNTNKFAWQNVTLTVSQGAGNSQTASANAGTPPNFEGNDGWLANACSTYATVTMAIFATAPVTVTATFSTVYAVDNSIYNVAWGANYSGNLWMTNPQTTRASSASYPGLYGGSDSPVQANFTGGWTPTSNTCKSTFPPDPTQIGQPLYVTCPSNGGTTTVSTTAPTNTSM